MGYSSHGNSSHGILNDSMTGIRCQSLKSGGLLALHGWLRRQKLDRGPPGLFGWHWIMLGASGAPIG